MAAKRMGWSSLSTDLLLAVFSLLPADADRLHFRGVCTAWRSAAASWRPRPWLVGSRTDRAGQDPTMSSFWLSRLAGLLPFAAAVPAGLEYLSSSRGYVALANPETNPKSLILLNPVSGNRIALPPIGFFKKWLDIAKVVLSADPDTTADWAALAVGFPTNCLAYYTPNAASWTRLDFHVAGYAGIEYYKGRFYVAFKFQVCVCELGPFAPAVIPIEHVDDRDTDDEMRIIETHLVECDGDLLLVSVWDDTEYNSDDEAGCFHARESSATSGDDEARRVEVHKVQWVGERVELVRQRSVGGHALFLGRNHAFALSPRDFPACRRNCIYLVDCQGHPDGLIRVVDMESQWLRCDAMLCPEDRPEFPSGWARRGWFFPHYQSLEITRHCIVAAAFKISVLLSSWCDLQSLAPGQMEKRKKTFSKTKQVLCGP